MAGNSVVSMNYGVIEKVVKGFNLNRDTLNTVSKTLEGIITFLRMTAFLSPFTSAALLRYFETIKSKIEKLMKLCDEFANDLSRAIDDHKKGDIKGKTYFGQGIQL